MRFLPRPGIINAWILYVSIRLGWKIAIKLNGYANTFNVFWNYHQKYYAPKEHNPPHIHAYFQEQKATFKILDGELIEGQLLTKQIRLIQAWIEIHQDELIADWELCQNGEKPYKIEPLK